MAHSGKLAGRIALVTGASRGIGRAVALRFGTEGAQVVAFARTTGALEELDDQIRAAGGLPAVIVNESLTDFDKIDRTGAALFERFGRLDVLVGNAAMLGQLSPLGHYTPKMWNDVFNLNVHANWRLIRAMDPLLRQSTAGRAIFVTSGVASRPAMYWGPYAASKAALEQMVKIYAAEMAHTPVKANILDPGRVRTKMRAQAYPGEDALALPMPESVSGLFVELALPTELRNGAVIAAQTADPSVR